MGKLAGDHEGRPYRRTGGRAAPARRRNFNRRGATPQLFTFKKSTLLPGGARKTVIFQHIKPMLAFAVSGCALPPIFRCGMLNESGN